jgi:hypothetical protein
MLHKVIQQNGAFLNGQECPLLSYEQIKPYLRSLHTYYKNEFGCEPVFLVDTVTNNYCGGYIVPSDSWEEILFEQYEETAEREIAAHHSKMLENLLA